MTDFIISYRTREDEPKDEVVIASYAINAPTDDIAKEKSAIEFSRDHPEISPDECQIDIQW